MTTQPAITLYGEKNAQAPTQLDLFSFLVGKWKGTGKTKAADGSPVQFELTWIGRFILNGMAIADEIHSPAPDGSPYLGITIRHFDTTQDSWIVEFLNVTNSFLRRQVNPQSGSVRADDGTVVVVSEDGETRIREYYRVPDRNHFVYSMELSRDAGQTWEPATFEFAMERVE
jgi:hypothetical protein